MTNNKQKKTTTISDEKSDLFLIGETLVDIFIDNLRHQHILFGGSPGNICINTKQLGLSPKLCSTIGRDSHGDFLVSTLEKYQIDTSFINRCDEKTSKVKVNQTSESPIPIFYRGCDFKINLTENIIQAVKDAKIFHFSFWPLTKEPSKSTVLRLIEVAKANNTLVSFDPNIHSGLISHETIDDDMLFDVLKKVDIIKPSLDDLERLFKKTATIDEFMDKLESLNIKLIMMTLGKDGVYVSYNNKRSLFPAIAKMVIDSTGAGDAFWSGFYAGYINHYSIEKCIHFAQITSGFAIKQIGTIIDAADIDYLIKLLKN